MMMTIAIVAVVIGLLMLGRWGYLKYQQKNEKNLFVVITATMLAIWFYPGCTLFLIGMLLLILLFGGCC